MSVKRSERTLIFMSDVFKSSVISSSEVVSSHYPTLRNCLLRSIVDK